MIIGGPVIIEGFKVCCRTSRMIVKRQADSALFQKNVDHIPEYIT